MEEKIKLVIGNRNVEIRTSTSYGEKPFEGACSGREHVGTLVRRTRVLDRV
jgi:hypothetical protein